MPMEFSLKLMAVIGPNFFDAEWEFINDMIYEVYHCRQASKAQTRGAFA